MSTHFRDWQNNQPERDRIAQQLKEESACPVCGSTEGGMICNCVLGDQVCKNNHSGICVPIR